MLCSHATQKKASHLTALLLLLTASISALLSLKVRFVFGMIEEIVHVCVFMLMMTCWLACTYVYNIPLF